MRRLATALVLATISAALLPGCASQRPRVEVLLPEHDGTAFLYATEFDDAVFNVGRDGDYFVLAEMGDYLSESLYIKLFWRPRPGVTSDDSSGTNAVIRYVVKGEDGVVVYEGGGYVYPKRRGDSNVMLAQLERARLHRLGGVGEPPINFEDVQLVGEVRARRDSVEAGRLLRAIEGVVEDVTPISVSD